MARSTYVFVAAVALATATFVYAAAPAANAVTVAERDSVAVRTSPETSPEVQAEVALPRPTLTLKALFAKVEEEEVVDTIDGVAVGMGAMEVLVARIDTDGRVVTSCVDSEKAARAFLNAPIEKVATKRAKEQ
jgi:hypothetical protein